RELRFALDGQRLRRAEAGIHRAGLRQAPELFVVNGTAFGLPVGGVRSAALRPLVPFESQPAQVVDDALDRGPAAAGLIGVLDAQQKNASELARQQPVEQRRARVA